MDLTLNPSTYPTFTTFGDLLKYLRRRQRLTQLELSIAVGYSEAQISRLEQNQRLSDLTTLKALFIPALHLEDEPQLVARFLELALSARQEYAPAPGITPYKGLLFFDEPDAEFFFGREALTAQLAKHVMDLAMDSFTRFLAVVGASGSGKSSLVRAGLAVALKRAGWTTHIFTPAEHPLRILEAKLNPIGTNNAERVLILVDQFEEVFTLCDDEMERIAFIEQLLSYAQEETKKYCVVIALRADFYSHCAQYPFLRQAVAAEQEYIGQMTIEELRRAIEAPARLGGWELVPELVEVMLQDLSAHGSREPEPGALPLLSHALLATWERRRGRTLTLEGYRASGGVRGAIAETAESVFTDKMDHKQQEIARDVFLRLTELGEGTEDTRRRAALNELVRQFAEASQLRAVLDTLAEARLITLNEDSAEVAHEALIREWQRLHEWLTQDREGLLLYRHLTISTHDWETRGHDSAELYRGARLAQAREWALVNEERLNPGERAFLAASIEQEEHDAWEREAQRQRELEAERQRAEEQAHSAARLRRRALYLVGVALIALMLAGAAILFANRAETEAQARATAEAIALKERDVAQAQHLAAEANSLMLNNGDTNLIALLSIRSLNKEYTQNGDAMLASLTTLEAPPRVLKGHAAQVWGLNFSPDGKYLVTVSRDRTARLWDVATGQTSFIIDGHTGEIGRFGDAVFSPDGKYLLTSGGPEEGDRDHKARLWDASSWQLVRAFSADGAGIEGLAFSPDGKTIATAGGADQTARIWDVATGKTLHVMTGHSISVPRVAFSPDGRYLLTASLDRTARLWDVGSGREVRVFSGHTDAVNSVAFSPDGQYIATGSDDSTARIWDVNTGQAVHVFAGGCVTFSPDGRFLLTCNNGNAMLWDIDTGETIRSFTGHIDGVRGAAFSPDGRLVATASGDGLARVWSLQNSPTGILYTEHTGPVKQASFSPDGKRVVTASDDGTVRIWEAATGDTVLTLNGHTGRVNSAVFSGDGKLVLTASDDGTARLWDASSGEELRRFEGHTDVVFRVIFSPDGKLVVSTSFDGTARVWDAQTAETLVIYTNQGPGRVNRVAFSPDGETVATSAEDGTARIWDPLTGEDRMVFEGHMKQLTGIAFSPDGKYLLTGSEDGTVRLWDVASGREVRRFAGHPGGASGVAFSPDGQTVLSGGYDGTARLWDVETGQELRRFTSHTSIVRNVAFSPDGKYILTASEDFTARLWLTDYHDTIRVFCALLSRDLTTEERLQFGITDQEPTCPVP